MSDEHCMETEPHANHEWLNQFIGEWTMENESWMGTDEPSIKMTATESVRSLGKHWILGESRGEMPGGAEWKALLTLGFDVAQDSFVGSWVGTMMTNLWTYNGNLDPDRRFLTLNTEGPGMAGGATRFQDIHEIISPDHRVQRSMMQGEDGQWIKFMEAHFNRV